jgi:2-hydroxychromene-2-carboxylate isomerase
MKTVDYYFCLNSPWSLFASKQLLELMPTLDIQLNLKPLNIGELFGAINFPPVPERPQYMQDYRIVELTRWSKRLAIPINLAPAFFPSNEIGGLALVLAAEQENGSGLQVAADLSNALWSQEANIANVDYLAEQAAKLGLLETVDPEKCAEIMSANTKELLARGGFGVPTFIVDDELIWGQDRIEFLVEAVS